MTVKPFPLPLKPKTWPVKFNIEGVTNPGMAKAIDVSKHQRAYLSPTDPEPGWYRAFSAAQYTIQAGVGIHGPCYLLTPVVNRPVYTFDHWGDFIEQSRNFAVSLFTTDFITDVAQYRVRHGPPLLHYVYRLPPDWTWREP